MLILEEALIRASPLGQLNQIYTHTHTRMHTPQGAPPLQQPLSLPSSLPSHRAPRWCWGVRDPVREPVCRCLHEHQAQEPYHYDHHDHLQPQRHCVQERRCCKSVYIIICMQGSLITAENCVRTLIFSY